mmetsp:Transcript_32890/g.37313  ORF Transcript_32890/g.37313 Transcript_32890/m.37313 type:complete len:1125 (-) Transcript_32890:156-3530(-)
MALQKRGLILLTVAILSLSGVGIWYLVNISNPCTAWAWDQVETFSTFDTQIIRPPDGCFQEDNFQTFTFPESESGFLRVTLYSNIELMTRSYHELGGQPARSAFSSGRYPWYYSTHDYPGHILTLEFTSTDDSRPLDYYLQIDQAVCDSFRFPPEVKFDGITRRVIESPHYYCDNMDVVQHYVFTDPGVQTIFFKPENPGSEFKNGDGVIITYFDRVENENKVVTIHPYDPPPFTMNTNEFFLNLYSDQGDTWFGYIYSLDPYPCAQWLDSGSEDQTLESSSFVESTHPYCDNLVNFRQEFTLNGSTFDPYVRITFDTRSSLKDGDTLVLGDSSGEVQEFSGSAFADAFIQGDSFYTEFNSNESGVDYGYGFEVELCGCYNYVIEEGSSFDTLDNQLIESPHDVDCPYLNVSKQYSWTDPEATSVVIIFNPNTSLDDHSSLTFTYSVESGESIEKTIRNDTRLQPFVIESSEFNLTFVSGSDSQYGFNFSAYPGPEGFLNIPAVPLVVGQTYNIESSHPYASNLNHTWSYESPSESVDLYRIRFEGNQTSLEENEDFLTFSYVDITLSQPADKRITGLDPQDFDIYATEFDLTFSSNDSVTDYGYKFTAEAVPCGQWRQPMTIVFDDLDERTVESSHNYCPSFNTTRHYSWSHVNATSLFIDFSHLTNIGEGSSLTLVYLDSESNSQKSKSYTGSDFDPLLIETSEFDLEFLTGTGEPEYGFKFQVYPGPSGFIHSPDMVLDLNREYTIQSSHPYGNNLNHTWHYSTSDDEVDLIQIRYTSEDSLEDNEDFLVFSYSDFEQGTTVTKEFTGQNFQDFDIHGRAFNLTFTSNDSATDYGFKFTAEAFACSEWQQQPDLTFDTLDPQTISSPTEYCRSGLSTPRNYNWTQPDATSLYIHFPEDTHIGNNTSIEFLYKDGAGNPQSQSRSSNLMLSPIVITDNEFDLEIILKDAYTPSEYTIGVYPGDEGFVNAPMISQLEQGHTYTIQSSHPYGDGIDHQWQYQTVGEEGRRVVVTFIGLAGYLEEDYDYLKFSYEDAQGSQLKSFTGDLPGKTLAIDSTVFEMQFISDGSNNGFGYECTFEVVGPADDDDNAAVGDQKSMETEKAARVLANHYQLWKEKLLSRNG